MSEIKQTDAAKLTREDTQTLMGWCDHQHGSLWDDMTLQDILNVYHVSHEWLTFEDWAEEEGDVARQAWNRVVSDPNHHLVLRR